MGFKSHPCTEDVINALLEALQAEGPSAQRIHAAAQGHVDQLRSVWDPTWTIQALDGLIRQMNQGGFRHVVVQVVGGSSCTPAKMTSIRLESLSDGST